MGLAAGIRLLKSVPFLFLLIASPLLAAVETPLRVITADVTDYDEQTQRLTARGNVIVEFREYRVMADVLDADLAERVATFRGRVTLTTPERVIEGTLLSLDLATRGYVLEGGRVVLPPEDLQIGAMASVFASGARIRGVPGRITIERGAVTTCNLDEPHYLFDAREVDIVPGTRLRARNVSAYALGHKLITLPGLSIPLRTLNQQSSRLVPVVGQSLDEGYFLKTAYFYVLGSLVGNLRLDLMSKKGIGLGLDQPYDYPTRNGTVHLYHLSDRRSGSQDTNARVDHRERLGEFTVQFGGDYRRNSLDYVQTASSSLLTDFSVNRRGRNGETTDLGFNRSATSFGGTDTGNWIGRLRHTQSFGAWRANANLNFSQPFGQATANVGRLNSHLDLNRTGKLFDTELVVDRVDTTGGTANFFTGVQRQPVLRFRSDTGRMFHSGFLGLPSPIQTELSIGHFKEAGFSSMSGVQEADQRLRTELRLGGSLQPLGTRGNHSLTIPMAFNQLWYREDEAQWYTSFTPSYIYRLGPNSRVQASYGILRQNGFTPFQFDFVPEYQNTSLSLQFGARLRGGYGAAYPGTGTSGIGSVGPLTGYGGYPAAGAGVGLLDPAETGKANVTLDTGYDFDNDTARDLIVRGQYQPTPHYQFGLSTGYDWSGKRRTPGFSRLRDIRGRLRVDYGTRLQLTVGALWDINRDRFGTVRAALNSQLAEGWQAQALYGNIYSGFGASQPYTHLMVTRDLHCWEASVILRDEKVYGTRQQDVRFILSIKAFPTNKEFGVSRTGQYLTSDIGDVF